MWLRAKLSAVIAACVLAPLALTVATVWFAGQDTQRDAAKREVVGATQAFVAALDDRLAQNLADLKAWSSLPVMQDVLIGDNGREIARVIDGFKNHYGDFSNLVVTDARGVVLAATTKRDIGQQLGNDDGFRAAASGETFQSPVAFRTTNEPEAIWFSVPLIAGYDRQTVIGTITGVLDLREIVKSVKALSPLASNDHIVIVTRRMDKHVVFATRTDANLLQSVRAAFARTPSGTDEISWQDTAYFATNVPATGKHLVRDPGLVVQGVSPATPATAAGAFAIAGVVGALAATAALAFAWRWSTPLVRLSNAMGRLTRGDVSVRAPEMASNHAFAPIARAYESFRQTRCVHDWLSTRERELLRGKEDAEHRLHEKSEHLASLARALRAQLSTIVELSEAINAEALDAAMGGQRLSHAKDISRSGTQLLAVINDLFDLSEAEAGHTTLRECEVDLAALVRESVDVMNDAAQKAKLTMTCGGADTPMTALVDAQKIKQIMFNLLSNAVKFTPEDGRVDVTLRLSADGRPTILIQDSGIGMPAKLTPIAASPFAGDTASGHGAGLGLPLVRRLVDLHEGTFEIESELGKGTTATVALPARRLVASDQDERLTA